MIEIRKEVKKDVVILHISGSIDSITAGKLKEEMDREIEDGRKFIIDLSDVNYVSSAGWGAILGRLKRIKQSGGDIVFCGMKREVQAIYNLLELDQIIKAFETVEDALSHFGVEVEEKKSLEERIKEIIVDDPLIHPRRLLQLLRDEGYDTGRIRIKRILRRMNLWKPMDRLLFAYNELKKGKK